MWTVSSNSPKELEKFQEDQGDNFREDDTHKPLFFNKKYPGVRTATLDRVSLPDGTVIYTINDLEKVLNMETLIDQEEAKLQAHIRVFGSAQQPRLMPVAAPTAKAETMVDEPAAGVGAGNENLGDAV
jgi:hypothetical protein